MSAQVENPEPTTPKSRRRPRRRSPSPTPNNGGAKHEKRDSTRFIRKEDLEKIAPDKDYKDLHVAPHEFRPSAVLTTGQIFHWKVVVESSSTSDADGGSAWGSHDATEWVGIIRVVGSQSIVVALKEQTDTVLYQTLYGPSDLDYPQILRTYFRLDIKLEALYSQWSKEDPVRLAQIARCIPGVRLIDQDPWECLVSFICSSNNNIPRITKMLTSIRQCYGSPLISIGNETLYSFPSLDELRKQANDADLRGRCGMGYRARYILETMDILHSLGGEKYLHDLRSLSDPGEVQEKLIQFCGVGRKVADCVGLFSLRQDDAIPVDVHVWNIARRDYDKEETLKDVKSLTPTIYQQVGDLFRSRFSEKAGWAHSLLFIAELPSFRPALPQEIVDEMEKFAGIEQARKKAKRSKEK